MVCHCEVSQLSLAKYVGGLVRWGLVGDIAGGGKSYGQFLTVLFVGKCHVRLRSETCTVLRCRWHVEIVV